MLRLKKLFSIVGGGKFLRFLHKIKKADHVALGLVKDNIRAKPVQQETLVLIAVQIDRLEHIPIPTAKGQRFIPKDRAAKFYCRSVVTPVADQSWRRRPEIHPRWLAACLGPNRLV